MVLPTLTISQAHTLQNNSKGNHLIIELLYSHLYACSFALRIFTTGIAIDFILK